MFKWFKNKFSSENLQAASKARTRELAINKCISLFNQGNNLLESGKLDDAADCYQQALDCNPDYADACTNLGFVFQLQGKPGDAIVLYRRALEFNPGLIMAQQNLGISLMNTGQMDGAEQCFLQVIAIHPDHPIALHNLGIIAAQRSEFQRAETLIRRAVESKDDYVEAFNSLGKVLQMSKRYAEAEAVYQRTLTLNPEFVEAYNNLGLLFSQSKRYSEAQAAYNRVLALTPDDAETCNSMGCLLMEIHQPQEAEAYFNRALLLNPGFAKVYNNLALLLVAENRLQDAEASFHRALHCKPDYTEALANLSTLLLTLGRYEEAWPYYEYRPTQSSIPPANLAQWKGESLSGKSLLIWPEQGFGDYIQFIRYAPLLKQRGLSRLTLFCSPHLKALLETVEGVDECITDSMSISHNDYWVFPLSLPLLFGTTLDNIPGAQSYLHALPSRMDKWRNRLPGDKLKIGLVWKGNPNQKNDANRSLPGLSILAPLWTVPDVTFISLQKGAGENEALIPPAEQPIIALGSDIVDFADTAAIIAQLDLVITVCTSTAHLAGAMGKPCWVLLTFGSDWRWLREREDSPWYASVQLFRQIRAGEWEHPVEGIRQALLDKLSL
jgi:tetratricopeptide (TPR) repeat protein